MQTYIESIYATGGNETEAYAKLMVVVPTILIGLRISREN
jgi:hypothetical protein